MKEREITMLFIGVGGLGIWNTNYCQMLAR